MCALKHIKVVKVKVKVVIYSPDILRFIRLYINSLKYWNSELTLSASSPWEECSTFSAAKAIHTVPNFILPGTYYCWVDIGGVDLKFAKALHDQHHRIEFQAPFSWVQHVNHSAIRCMVKSDIAETQLFILTSYVPLIGTISSEGCSG